MTDYKNLKLIASSSPHIRSKDNTRSIMLDVIIALLPALVGVIRSLITRGKTESFTVSEIFSLICC